MSKNRKKVYAASLLAFGTTAILATVLLPAFLIPRGGYSNVAFVPNTNNVYDKSFNEETNKGISKYQTTFGEDVPSYIPSSYLPSNSEFYEIYGSAITSGGANVVMGNSFTQAAPMTGFCSNGDYWTEQDCVNNEYVWTDGLAVEYPDVSFILLDDSGLKNYENGLSVNYAAMDAGFMAGVMAAMYATAVHNPGEDGIIGNSDDQEAMVGTWGGAQYGTVYDWMSGYEQAINWWNHAILGYDVTGAMGADSNASGTGTEFVEVDSIAELTPTGGGVDYQNNTLGLHSQGYDYVQLTQGSQWTSDSDTYKNLDDTGYNSTTPGYIVTDPADIWYMGNFEIGTASDTRANNIEEAGASVVFPVAGGQFISAFTQTDMQVIGVDTDIVPTYDALYGDQILGSATKNLSFGAESSLWVMDRYVYTFDTYYQGFDDSIRATTVMPDGTTGSEYNEEWTLADEKMYWITVGNAEQLAKTTGSDGDTENYLNYEVDIYTSEDDTVADTQVYTWDASTYTYDVVVDDNNTPDVDESEQTGWVSNSAGQWYQGTSTNGGTGWASGDGSGVAWTSFSAILDAYSIDYTGITSEQGIIDAALEANSIEINGVYVPQIEYQSPTFLHNDDGGVWHYGYKGDDGNANTFDGFKWIPN